MTSLRRPALALTLALASACGTLQPPPAAGITVTSVSPARGPASGGTIVTVTGTGFAIGAALSVSFGGAAATDVSVGSTTSATCATTVHAAGVVDVVITLGNTSVTLPAAFTYVAPSTPPAVSAISPSSGPIAGGTVVTVAGTGFATGATFKVGGVAATNVAFNSATSLSGTTGAHAAGAVEVVVTNPDGLSGTLASGFTYAAPGTAPTVTAITPAQGEAAGGTAITVAGTGLASGATVTLGGAAVTNVTFLSATSISATAPAHAAGAVDVVVTNPGGLSGTLTNGFTYLAPAPAVTITSVAPAVGPVAGGTSVTIAGTSFASGAIILFGNATGTAVNVTSSTSISVTTPAHSAGPVDVTVTLGGVSTTKPGAFTYQGPAPTLTGVSPVSGPNTGGTAVSLSGTGFVTGAIVTFGGTAATQVIVANPTTITCTTPAHPSGLVAAQVANPDQQTVLQLDAFTFEDAPPTIATVIPSSGALGGGDLITIAGTGFRAGVAVTFNGMQASNVTLVDGQHLTVTTPLFDSTAATYADITVTNSDTTVADAPQAFLWAPALAQLLVFDNGTALAGLSGSAVLAFDPAALNTSSTAPAAYLNGTSTALSAPSNGFIDDAQGLLYLTNNRPAGQGSLAGFDWPPSGSDIAPSFFIAYGSATGTDLSQPLGIAWDKQNAQVLVGNFLTGDIAVFDQSNLTPTVPAEIIKTRGGGLTGIAFDPVHRELYALNANSTTLDVYDRNSTSTAPVRTVQFPAGSSVYGSLNGLAINGDEVFVLGSKAIVALLSRDQGTLVPQRVIQGAATKLQNCAGLGYDRAANTLFAACRDTHGVFAFGHGAHGDVAPELELTGGGTGIGDPFGVCVSTSAP